MSYITDKFKAGEVKMRSKVCGWYFPNTDEFRPLMNDAMIELLEAGLVTNAHIAATMVARNAHEKQALESYAKGQEEFWGDPANKEAQDEELYEMKAAFGTLNARSRQSPAVTEDAWILISTSLFLG